MTETLDAEGMRRRTMLRKLAGAGVGITAAASISTSPAFAGIFSLRCAPGTVTASASFVRTACVSASTTITITIVFAGPCPCGGPAIWCARKNTPTPVVSSAVSTLSFSVVVPYLTTININGRVALGCRDRDFDRQFAVYNWAMTATDDGSACSGTVNSISAVTLSGRTAVESATCPPLTALVAAAAPSSSPSMGTGTRPE